jgi:hypothetical protein
MASGQNGPFPDPVSRRILQEMHDMHGEMRAMRVEMRAMGGEMRAMRIEAREDRRRSDERFERVLREFREDSVRRDAAFQKAFRDVRTVGLSIVKTLNRHTHILTRIDRKLGARGNGSPGPGNGRGL